MLPAVQKTRFAFFDNPFSLPTILPLAFSDLSPAIVLVRIRTFSNSEVMLKILNISLPCAFVVFRGSYKLIESTFLAIKSFVILMRCCKDLTIQSNF